MDTLILNKDGQPLSLLPISAITWQTAIRLLFLDKIYSIRDYDDWVVRSPSITMKVPSIVVTKDYIKWNRIVKYNRSNILLRDDYTCQFCNKKYHVSELTLDHVVPRSKGGKTNWTNITTSCYDCNARKGNDETVRPKKVPKKPSYYEMIAKRQQYPIRISDKSWLDYLVWPEHLVQIKR